MCDIIFSIFIFAISNEPTFELGERINYCGFYFRDSVCSPRNRENKNQAKISRYTVYGCKKIKPTVQGCQKNKHETYRTLDDHYVILSKSRPVNHGQAQRDEIPIVCRLDHRNRPGKRVLLKHILQTIFYQP